MSQKRTSPRGKAMKRPESEGSSSVQLFEVSPSKKKKFSSEQLRNLSTENRPLPIGELMQLPQENNGVIQRGDTEKSLGCSSVTITGVVVDNRVGRLAPSERERKGNRFIYIADCTGFVSVGIDAESSGLCEYDLPEEDCTDEARLFFAAELSGVVSWVPTKRDSGKPTYFMNKAKISKIEELKWDDKLRMLYPTSLVCQNLAESQFASSHLFATVAFAGKLDEYVFNRSNSLVLYIEDVVGYAVIEVSFPESLTDLTKQDGTDFIKQNSLSKGGIFYFSGPLAIQAVDGHAWLKCRGDNLKVAVIPEDDYASFGQVLLTRPYFGFLSGGVEMASTPDRQ